MVKTKKIMAECTACDKMVQVNVPVDAAEGKDYYPFEYIDIHGDPEHALMLFLDRNLNLRDSMVYTNLRFAKERGKEFEKLTKMTENEALFAIYEDPIRLRLFMLLTEGPKKTDDIVDELKKEKGFKEGDLNFLVLPLIKIGMIKSSWLKETFSECYFLLKDFILMRTPAKLAAETISKDSKFVSILSQYFSRMKEAIDKFGEELSSGTFMQIELNKKGLGILNDLECRKIFRELRTMPLPKEDLKNLVKEEALAKMTRENYVVELNVGDVTYCALLTDLKVEQFRPDYIISNIQEKYNNKEISREMVSAHLDLLFNAEIH